MSKLFCWKCGQLLSLQLEIAPESRYCHKCGARVIKPNIKMNKNIISPTSSSLSDNNNSDDNNSDNNEIEKKYNIILTNEQHIIDESHLLRGQRWIEILMINELRSHFNPNLYYKLLNTKTIYLRKIRKDIKRTFPDHIFFREDNENNRRNALENVLKAYSVYDSDIGYSQGMAFIVGQLLIHMKEDDTFWCFVKLMYSPKHNLRDIFNGNCDVLPLCLKEFDRILEQTRPKLFQHLTQQGIDASMYATQWFLTIFIYRFPTSCLPLIWDRFISIGIVAIFQVGLAILTYFSLDLLQLSSDELIPFFNALHTQQIPDEIIEMSRNIRVKRNEFQYIKSYFEADVPIINDNGRKREISL